MEIRPVRPDEYRAAGLVTARAYDEFGRQDDPGWMQYRARLANVESRAARTLVLGAFQGDRVIGTATLELQDRVPGGRPRPELRSDEAHLRMVGVDADARRRGAGRALVEACIEEARKAGKRTLTLDTAEWMQAAQKMYESMGFRRGPDIVLDDGFRLITYELDIGERATTEA